MASPLIAVRFGRTARLKDGSGSTIKSANRPMAISLLSKAFGDRRYAHPAIAIPQTSIHISISF